MSHNSNSLKKLINFEKNGSGSKEEVTEDSKLLKDGIMHNENNNSTINNFNNNTSILANGKVQDVQD